MSKGTNGRPEPEVIVGFGDGFAYSKGKMEEAFRSGILEKAPKPSKEAFSGKKEDVDLIVSQLEVSRPQAEKALSQHEGNVVKALVALIQSSS